MLSYLLVCSMLFEFSLFILCVTSLVIGFMNAPKSTINVNFCVTEMLCFAGILSASRTGETRHASSISFILRQMDGATYIKVTHIKLIRTLPITNLCTCSRIIFLFSCLRHTYTHPHTQLESCFIILLALCCFSFAFCTSRVKGLKLQTYC